jgi:hypothetical protein
MMDRARELLSLEASWTDQAKLIGSDGLRSSLVNVEAGESGWTKLLRLDIEQIERALVLQSQFSALLLVVGASSGGLMASSPDRPGEGEHRVDRWAPDQAGQQPAQLGDGERDQHAPGRSPPPPPDPAVAIGKAGAGDGQERQRDHRQSDVPIPGVVAADLVVV